MGLDFMVYFNILIAIYILYYAIRGKGRVYDVDYPEAAKKEYCGMMRKFCWIVGAFMLALSVIELLIMNSVPAVIYLTISWINIGAVLTAVIIFVIVTKKKFGKYQK